MNIALNIDMIQPKTAYNSSSQTVGQGPNMVLGIFLTVVMSLASLTLVLIQLSHKIWFRVEFSPLDLV